MVVDRGSQNKDPAALGLVIAGPIELRCGVQVAEPV
jgi:hypothetical protein